MFTLVLSLVSSLESPSAAVLEVGMTCTSDSLCKSTCCEKNIVMKSTAVVGYELWNNTYAYQQNDLTDIDELRDLLLEYGTKETKEGINYYSSSQFGILNVPESILTYDP